MRKRKTGTTEYWDARRCKAGKPIFLRNRTLNSPLTSEMAYLLCSQLHKGEFVNGGFYILFTGDSNPFARMDKKRNEKNHKRVFKRQFT